MAVVTRRPVLAPSFPWRTLGVLALLALLGGALKALSWWIAYSRIGRDEVLENATRRRVHDHVQANPGVGIRAVGRALGLVEGIVRHHVLVLETHGFVVSRRVDGRRGLFLAGTPSQGWTAPPHPTRQRLLERLADSRQPWTQKQLAEALGLSTRVVSYHLAALLQEGAARTLPGWPTRYAAAPREERPREDPTG